MGLFLDTFKRQKKNGSERFIFTLDELWGPSCPRKAPLGHPRGGTPHLVVYKKPRWHFHLHSPAHFRRVHPSSKNIMVTPQDLFLASVHVRKTSRGSEGPGVYMILRDPEDPLHIGCGFYGLRKSFDGYDPEEEALVSWIDQDSGNERTEKFTWEAIEESSKRVAKGITPEDIPPFTPKIQELKEDSMCERDLVVEEVS